MKYGKSEFLSFSIVEIVKIVVSEETLDYYQRMILKTGITGQK